MQVFVKQPCSVRFARFPGNAMAPAVFSECFLRILLERRANPVYVFEEKKQGAVRGAMNPRRKQT